MVKTLLELIVNGYVDFIYSNKTNLLIVVDYFDNNKVYGCEPVFKFIKIFPSFLHKLIALIVSI